MDSIENVNHFIIDVLIFKEEAQWNLQSLKQEAFSGNYYNIYYGQTQQLFQDSENVPVAICKGKIL